MKTTEIYCVIKKENPHQIIGDIIFNDLESAELYSGCIVNSEAISLAEALQKISEHCFDVGLNQSGSPMMGMSY